MKHFSTDLRKSQEGSEQKWGADPPIPPVAKPLQLTSFSTDVNLSGE